MPEQTVRTRTRRRDMDLGERPEGARQDTRRRAAKEIENPHITVMREYTQQQQLDDPWKGQYGAVTGTSLTILQPTFNFNSLIRLPRENNILQQCIDAMVTNTVGHGHRLVFSGPEGTEESAEAAAEKARIEGVLDYPNDEYSLQELLERMKRDKETIGTGYMEVGRGADGFPCMLAHVPGHTMRKTMRDQEATEVDVALPRNGKIEKVRIRKRFRRYVQQVGSKKVWFKEFGDPRKIDPGTGLENNALPLDRQATEIITDEMYAPGEAYAVPRWIGQMPSILTSRELELTNLDFFKENAIPAAALLVSGGQVTQASLDAIEQHFTLIRGRQSFNRITVIEVQGDETAADADGKIPAPKVELKALSDARQKEGNFLELNRECATSVRSSFRLPAIFTGHSQDYTYATAKTSFEVAENQVFGPERNKTDEIVKRVLSPYEMKYWEFRLQPPRISDPEEVVKALEAFDKMGGMTPNRAIEMANELFDLDVAAIDAKWGDWPFEIVKALATNGALKGMEEIADTLAMEEANAEGAADAPGPPYIALISRRSSSILSRPR